MIDMIDAKLLLSFTATAYAAENDYLIKLINTFDNEKQEDIFRTMHDPNHRHPRHRGTHLLNFFFFSKRIILYKTKIRRGIVLCNFQI